MRTDRRQKWTYLRDRRKYHDSTEELNLKTALMGAVIRQAFDDVERRPVALKMWQEFNGLKYKSMKQSRERLDQLREEVKACNDAVEFFETSRLEDFVHTYTLPINPSYLRMKYKTLTKKILTK